MAKSHFIAIEVVDGKVQKVEGEIASPGIFGSAYFFMFQPINEVLNKCAGEGYELFDTDTIGNKKIYRMKLRTS